MTYKDKGSYESTPPCTETQVSQVVRREPCHSKETYFTQKRPTSLKRDLLHSKETYIDMSYRDSGEP